MSTDTAGATVDHQPIDADNHYYEPYDAFTRYIEPEFADRCVRVVKADDGMGRLWFGDKRFSLMRVIQTDYIGAPGTNRDLFEDNDVSTGFVQKERINGHDFPEYMGRAARLQKMDEQGLGAVLLFPSMALTVEHEMHDDIEATYANLRSFNRWLEDDWGYGNDGRIFGVPLISLLEPELAMLEVERVLERGARLVHVKQGPPSNGGRSPGHPMYDPVWARVSEAGVPVALHSADSGYNELVSTQWGEAARPAIQDMSPFQWYLGMHGTPVADTLAAMALNNVFGRFPSLKILSVENGFAWLAHLLHTADFGAKLGRRGKALGGHALGKPSEILREHLYVSPFPEEDPNELAALIGVDRVLFGSDYPHSEGLPDPTEFALKLAGWPEADRVKVMHDNAAELLGLPKIH